MAHDATASSLFSFLSLSLSRLVLWLLLLTRAAAATSAGTGQERGADIAANAPESVGLLAGPCARLVEKIRHGLAEDTASSARPVASRAQAAHAHPRARPQRLGSSPWPPELA